MAENKNQSLKAFIAESNRIEGILREPTQAEIDVTAVFLGLRQIDIAALEGLVSVYAPGHRLHTTPGLNVRVGNYVAPPGGPEIETDLHTLLRSANDRSITPHEAHIRYETLHPFTDGNGRSGRALWAWMMGSIPKIGFLHTFYYQTLQGAHG